MIILNKKEKTINNFYQIEIIKLTLTRFFLLNFSLNKIAILFSFICLKSISSCVFFVVIVCWFLLIDIKFFVLVDCKFKYNSSCKELLCLKYSFLKAYLVNNSLSFKQRLILTDLNRISRATTLLAYTLSNL